MKNIDKRTINNLIESTRKNSLTGVEEICKRMGIAQSDINFLLNSEKKSSKERKVVMEDRIALVIIAVLIVAAPFIVYIWQGRNGGIG